MTNSNALIQPDKGQDAIAIHLVNKDSLPAWLANLNNQQRAALAAQKFDGGGYEYAGGDLSPRRRRCRPRHAGLGHRPVSV
jgi:hypothetical protein